MCNDLCGLSSAQVKIEEQIIYCRLSRRIIHLPHKVSISIIAFAPKSSPLAMWAFTDGWLFAGWCELRKGFSRAFRLDRIIAIEESGCQFPDDPSQDLQAYLAAKIFAVETGKHSA